MIRTLITALAMAAVVPAARPRTSSSSPTGQRIVFLGDSNTFAGHYVAYLDAYLFTRFPIANMN